MTDHQAEIWAGMTGPPQVAILPRYVNVAIFGWGLRNMTNMCGAVDILVSVLLAHEAFVICDLSDHTQALDEN